MITPELLLLSKNSCTIAQTYLLQNTCFLHTNRGTYADSARDWTQPTIADYLKLIMHTYFPITNQSEINLVKRA
jgi:hypothetical protein